MSGSAARERKTSSEQRYSRTTLAIVGMLMSVVSAFYYLRVVVHMYMKEPIGDDDWAPVPRSAAVAMAVAVAVVLALGVYPLPLIELCRAAAQAIY